MLVNLHVKNLAIIDEIDIDFTEHLNILSGETGAGKSIILGSVNMALGGKVSSDCIRKGADYALIELVFQVNDKNVLDKMDELELPVEDGQIILSRKIMKSRSMSKVNGETVTAGTLKILSALLIDIHGQHEHQSLLDKNKHLQIVDRFAWQQIEPIKEKLEEAYKEYIAVRKELTEKSVPEEERNRQLSFLEYEVNEIESARLTPKEDETLEIRYRKMSNANMIMGNLSEVYQILEGATESSVEEKIGKAVRMLNKSIEYDENLQTLEGQLVEIEDLIGIFKRDLKNYMEEMDYNQEEFSEVEERLNLIHNLKAKYGNTIEEILNYCEAAKEKVERYRDFDMYIERLKKKEVEKEQILEKYCMQLTEIRRKVSKVLAKKMKDALVDLNFLDVRFEISINELDKYTVQGKDEIEFIISTNPGEDMKPLGKVASGGELSRIMLAIKSVLAEEDSIDTLIFDEIDVGISGRTAQKVSEKMAYIAAGHQVICITHLPQIAAMADSHYLIEKTIYQQHTQTEIRKLDGVGAIEELARILGGAKITDAVLESAHEMKELAQNVKSYC